MDRWDVLNILRCHGLVATSQRLRMLSFFLSEYGRPDSFMIVGDEKELILAKRVHDALMEEGYFISLMSIYRNIRLFKRLGLLGDDVF
ncbi:MAG: hypothetical protein PHQ32_05740 [Firmicutes bacterium]|nr:hypothetical protein [Bacillota bacterium]